MRGIILYYGKSAFLLANKFLDACKHRRHIISEFLFEHFCRGGSTETLHTDNLITFYGDLIKAKIPLNLVATYLIFLAAFTVFKFVVPIIIEKIRG